MHVFKFDNRPGGSHRAGKPHISPQSGVISQIMTAGWLVLNVAIHRNGNFAGGAFFAQRIP
jgi:hypothetical protein